jgi:hypothetical protein
MALFSNQMAAISRIHPLVYLTAYLAAIPLFGIGYAEVTPNGFFAPYTRYDPGSVSDRQALAVGIESALRRSFDERKVDSFQAGNWSIEPASVSVSNVESTDGSRVSLTISVSGAGVGDFSGARTTRWSVVVSVPEHPLSFSASSGPGHRPTYYHVPEVDLSRYAPPYKEETEQLFRILFNPGEHHLVRSESLALNDVEESGFRRYLLGVKGDVSSIGGNRWRMVYFSAIVITTLGLGDIVPISSPARTLVALEAIAGITCAGLFLNALAYRASPESINGGRAITRLYRATRTVWNVPAPWHFC